MGGVAWGLGDLIAGQGGQAPLPSDRFGRWRQTPAIALLWGLLALLAASALVPLTASPIASPTTAPAPHRPRDADLALYDRAIARIAHGENYYTFITAEHRRAHYPIRPGVAVRLPTLAYLAAALGVDEAQPAPLAMAAALALMLGVIGAWWRRLGALGVSPSQRRLGTALVFFGAALGLNRYYFVLHELWSGMLLALALGLHRPDQGQWRAAFLAAALALAIREHAAPFVLLMAAMAAHRCAWPEAAAWVLLLALFAAALAWHLHLIAAQTLPSDPTGPGWLALRGLGGFLSNTVLSSNLRFLPHQIAGPLTILMLLGWAGWRSSAGQAGLAFFLGYALLFAIAGRDDNFYWGAMITPLMPLGLAFAPMALASLLRAALSPSHLAPLSSITQTCSANTSCSSSAAASRPINPAN